MSERLTKRKDYGCACWNGDQNIVTHRRYMELLDALAKYEDTGLMPDEIEKMKSPRPDWTPCAEGMPTPDDGQFVNVTHEYCGERKSSSATYHKLSGNYYGCDKYGSMMLGVIAWQPLPEPYNPDHIPDATKKVDQFREPTEMMQEDDVSKWPDWKKRAATCNYEFGKED